MTLLFALLFFQTSAELSDEAQRLAKSGNTAEAEKLWQRALDQSPKFFPALFNLGYMNYSLERFEQACEFLEQAAQVSPNDFNTHYLLGAANSRLGKVDTALRAWRKAESIQPNSLRLLQAMIVEYGKGHYYEDAARTAKRALALNPTMPNLYFLTIKALQDSGDYAGAFEIASQAVKRFPKRLARISSTDFICRNSGVLTRACRACTVRSSWILFTKSRDTFTEIYCSNKVSAKRAFPILKLRSESATTIFRPAWN